MTLIFTINDQRSITEIASNRDARYLLPVAAKSAIGFDGLTNSRRNSAQITTASAFFASAVPCNGGCAWGTLGCAGFLDSLSVNPRTAAP